jgi:N-acetyl-anhydromuramyl-L-alanine amidase AmpD
VGAPGFLAACLGVFALASCGALPAGPHVRFAAGSAIVACGERVPIDAPVVLWTMEPHYDAYAEGPRFSAEGPQGRRYRSGRAACTNELAAAVERSGWTRARLAEQIDLLVLHYDAAGTSRDCFRVLQDERELSVHFLLDLDGTLYQTLDLREEAWHARAANRRSIGVEIAQIGAYPESDRARLARHYEWTEQGLRLRLTPEDRAGLRLAEAKLGPSRAELVQGPIHGQTFLQHDFTPEQYESLAALAATLAEIFPRIDLDAPRDSGGRVRTDALTDDEEARFHGVVGHYHLQTDKRDPGPAFDWERFLGEARARRGAPARGTRR